MYNHGIYVHIPFCKARCHYCAFSSCCDYTLQQAYFDKLFGEVDARADKRVKISTIYLGGGTPSSVDTQYLDKLFDKLNQRFDLSQTAETSVECNPESVTEELLACLKRNNVNRLSFGLQSCCDDTLKRIGRIHRYSDFIRALELSRECGFDNINADLILGLPEDVADFYKSVQTVAALPLTHVSVYALELYERSPIYNLCKTQYCFDDDALADMYDYAVAVLADNGFCRYEISNFAKAGRQCRHNLNYWDEGRYFAFGAAASGFVRDLRYTNPYAIKDYMNASTDALLNSGQKVSLNEQADEYAMLRLRLADGVDLNEFSGRYKSDFCVFFPNARRLVEQGLLVLSDGRAFVPTDKIYVTNSILSELLNF